MTAQPPLASRTAALLHSHEDEIASAWAEMVHALPGTRYGEYPGSELRSWTARGVRDAIQALSTGSYQTTETFLKDASAACLASGIDISEAIEGLWLLVDAARHVIGQHCPAGSDEASEAEAHLDIYLRSVISRFGRLSVEEVTRHFQTRQQRIALTVESLQRVTAALLQKLVLDQVLEIVLHEACRLTGAQGGALLTWDGGDWLTIVCAEGVFQSSPNRIPVEGTSAGRVVQAGVPLLVNDSRDLALGSQLLPHLESLLVIPMRLKGAVVGVLDIAGKPGGFTEDDIRVLSLFADGATIAIESARLHFREEELAVMEERQRLARELHDSVTQALYSMSLHAEAAGLALSAGKQEVAKSSLQKVLTMAREATMDLRMVILDLRHPMLEEEGLAAALQARLAAVGSLAGLQTAIRVEGEEHLPASTADALFWIAVEAFSNVVRHANARQVRVVLRFDSPGVYMEISDDGQGFDPAEVGDDEGMGLRDMQERAQRIEARLAVTSVPGQGTTVRVDAGISKAGGNHGSAEDSSTGR